MDLNDLIIDNNEIEKYYKSYNSFPHGKYSKNIYENAKQFILKKEQIFILDNGKKNYDDNFYFNDLNIDNYDEELEKKIFTPNNKYPINYYKNLIKHLKIKRLSNVEKIYGNRKLIGNFDIKSYRKMLNFAYDLLFTKFSTQYKRLEEREEELKKLNLVNKINIYTDIISQIKIDDILIELDKVKFYFKNEELYIINEDNLFKIIAEKIDFISDKDIKDFYNEVIKNNQIKNKYYNTEDIKEKHNFPLEISDKIIEVNNYSNEDYDYEDNEDDYGSKENKNNGDIPEKLCLNAKIIAKNHRIFS
jgi:hypothetical protein